ncbi:MAG: transcriptional regulator, partial [Proteobacteria bacterium]|nr:transcriptional regulator [Pseudomonadota bacterium]
SGLSAEATELANLLADSIADLDDATIQRLLDEVKRAGV